MAARDRYWDPAVGGGQCGQGHLRPSVYLCFRTIHMGAESSEMLVEVGGVMWRRLESQQGGSGAVLSVTGREWKCG